MTVDELDNGGSHEGPKSDSPEPLPDLVVEDGDLPSDAAAVTLTRADLAALPEEESPAGYRLDPPVT